jgi:predicted CopG family antitoxin
MTQKINISEEAYKKLLELKKNNESFSKLILRIINEKEKISSIEEFAGAFEEDSEEWEKIEKFLYAERLKGRTEQNIEL